MGKMQPNIHNRKRRKFFKNIPSSKKSKRSNIHSKRNKKNYSSFYSQSGYNSKKSSKKKYLENSSKRKKRNAEIIKNINIPTKSSISYNNFNNFYNCNIFLNDTNLQIPKGRPEWMSKETEKIEEQKIRFGKEILEYVNYITPNNKSFSMRQTTVQILKQVIKRKRPEWKVHLFGSFRQGTSTVFSDLDFEIIIDKNSSRKRDIDELFFLMKILKNNEFSNNIRLIRARVPILKATCTTTGISVDISVNRHNGYQAADLIKKIISRHQILKPIIIILKMLLKKNNLNEAHSGGMSSFLLFHLIFFFYNLYIKENLKKISFENYEQKNDNNHSHNKSKREKYNEVFTEESIESDDYDESKSDKVFTLTKTTSITDDEYNSNDGDSNIIHNGESSSNSDSEQKTEKKSEIHDIEMGNRLKLQNSPNSSEEHSKNYDNSDEEEDENIVDKKELLDKSGDVDIVDFLLKFLYFYSKMFKYEYQGIKVTENESYETYFKAERYDMDCSDTISVESIQEPGIDIGKSCFKYLFITNIFYDTYIKIKREMNNNTNSILQFLSFPTV